MLPAYDEGIDLRVGWLDQAGHAHWVFGLPVQWCRGASRRSPPAWQAGCPLSIIAARTRTARGRSRSRATGLPPVDPRPVIHLDQVPTIVVGEPPWCQVNTRQPGARFARTGHLGRRSLARSAGGASAVGGEVAVAGEATRLLERFGGRCAAAVRVATLPPVIAVGLLRAYPERLWPTLLVVVVAAAWTCGYAWRLSQERERPPVTADAAVLLAVCLIALWSGAVDAANTGWLRLLVTFACVTWQWHVPPLAGAVAALVTGGGMLVTISAAGPNVNAGQIWVLAMAALSRAVWVLITRAAQRADRMAAEAEEARRASAVAAAVRDEERELANALHDTAATTLLMVGTGQVPADTAWLAAQAGRDLARLRSRGGASPAAADLVGLLRDDVDSTHLTVDLDAREHVVLPFDVASAIAGAVREALNNVRRHAGTDRAVVRVHGDARELCVEVVDAGRGFSAEAGPARRGLRESVHGRMNRVGGTATITSSDGTGTTVRLEWRAERG